MALSNVSGGAVPAASHEHVSPQQTNEPSEKPEGNSPGKSGVMDSNTPAERQGRSLVDRLLKGVEAGAPVFQLARLGLHDSSTPAHISTLILKTAVARELANKLEELPFVRGVTESKMVNEQLAIIAERGEGNFPAFWGFQDTSGGVDLRPAAENTLKAYKALESAVPGIKLTVTIMKANSHAEHNGIPRENYEPYYAAIQELAEKHGLPTVWLSKVETGVGTNPEKIHASGKEELQEFKFKGVKPSKGDDRRAVPNQMQTVLTRQAQHMWDRYKSVFTREKLGGILQEAAERIGTPLSEKTLELLPSVLKRLFPLDTDDKTDQNAFPPDNKWGRKQLQALGGAEKEIKRALDNAAMLKASDYAQNFSTYAHELFPGFYFSS